MSSPFGPRLRRSASRAAQNGLVCAALVSVGITGCARPAATASGSALQVRGALIEVRNNEFDDDVVYVVRNGTRIRLGVVPALSSRTFYMGPSLLDDGSGLVLGTGRPGQPIERVTSPFNLPRGRIAIWDLAGAKRVEQPVVR